jgi:hypothetical protein
VPQRGFFGSKFKMRARTRAKKYNPYGTNFFWYVPGEGDFLRKNRKFFDK